MEFLGVIVAALAGFGTGAIWYISLSKPWMAAAGIPIGADGRPANGSSPTPLLVALGAMLLVAGMMRHVFVMAGVRGLGESFLSGLAIGAFFVAPWLAMDYAYSMRDPRLAWIDGGYAALGCGVIGGVLSLFL